MMSPEEEWILNALKTEHEVSCVNSDFMLRFIQAFPDKRNKAHPFMPIFHSPKAMETIKSLYQQGKLKRKVVGLSGMGRGWPRWVWSYFLP